MIVVANGCTDATAQVARAFGPLVRVIETDDANKYRAMRLADQAAGPEAFPRLYVDADIEFGIGDARLMAAALSTQTSPSVPEDAAASPVASGSGAGWLAAAPERRIPMDGVPWTVRWYYNVWTRLRTVRTGLFGRGVIGVSKEGFARIDALPELMGDDLAASLVFAAHERGVVAGAGAVVHPPRTVRDLIKRRIRTTTVTTQAGGRGELAAAGAAARTSKADLLEVLREAPVWMAPRVAWFLYITVVARRRAQKAVAAGDFRTWLRDESSRVVATAAESTAGAGAVAESSVAREADLPAAHGAAASVDVASDSTAISQATQSVDAPEVAADGAPSLGTEPTGIQDAAQTGRSAA